ncbi:hypothetical protein ES703_30504 [subsurface metagenome]
MWGWWRRCHGVPRYGSMVRLPQQFSLRISDYYVAVIGQYYPPPVEATHLFDKRLNSRPVTMSVVITEQLKSHPAAAYFLAALPELPDFTPDALDGKEGYRANGDHYHHGESHQETKPKTMYHCLPLGTCSRCRRPSLCIGNGGSLAQAFGAG